MDIITLTHKSAKSYLIGSNHNYVMFDAGWIDSYRDFMIQMKENKIKLEDIKYLIVSHFHIDHAGLVQVLKDYGVTLLMLDNQVQGIDEINNFYEKKPNSDFVKLKHENNSVVNTTESRKLLEEIGIKGAIIETPGHSLDSVSLVIDNQCIFIGDLPPFEMADANDEKVMKDWIKIFEMDIKSVYPAHAPAFEI